MMDEKRPLLMELCYTLHRRNQIEIRRRSAKNKIYYYEQMKSTVQAYKGTNTRVLSLQRDIKVLERRQMQMGGNVSGELKAKCHALEVEKRNLATIVNMKSKPTKWIGKVSELNKLILKHRADYMKARYDTAKLTCQTRKRVYRLCKLLNANINYGMGTAFVQSITINHGPNKAPDLIGHKEFELMYREVEANKAIEKMLRSKDEETAQKEAKNN